MLTEKALEDNRYLFSRNGDRLLVKIENDKVIKAQANERGEKDWLELTPLPDLLDDIRKANRLTFHIDHAEIHTYVPLFEDRDEYWDWDNENCRKCRQTDEETGELVGNCTLAVAIFLALDGSNDGLISPELFKELGGKEGSYLGKCAKFQKRRELNEEHHLEEVNDPNQLKMFPLAMVKKK